MNQAAMTLVRFRVTDFRSVQDSGWIDANEITALIGTNEAGKTNLLLPLWKLNPANEGEIDPLADYPRKRYGEIRGLKEKPVFIRATFELGEALAASIAKQCGCSADSVREVEVSRRYLATPVVSFPDTARPGSVSASDVVMPLEQARTAITNHSPTDAQETQAAEAVQVRLAKAIDLATKAGDSIDAACLAAIGTAIRYSEFGDAANGPVAKAHQSATRAVDGLLATLRAKSANDSDEAKQLVLQNLPVFVYYTTYGNLDSEIYLPHVIDNLEREDLSGKEEAKARTLRVLFDFVTLKPSEILDLGKETSAPTVSKEEIETVAEHKREREILLQSASTKLTDEFRHWWRQGDYRIRFQADGNHFRIWVSDDKRTEEIELEGRSSGLQWFLSFYLVFLVESQHAHVGAILLLDEPGHSLHPIAQHDLSEFFQGLADSNQLLYTTHSPFLVDSDHLDRVRAVYVDGDGYTCASSDLRAGRVDAQERSIYPVHAALGLSVSETLLQGCSPVIVEGPSDQIVMSAIKTLLLARGHLTPRREIVFVPAGGTRGVKAAASILAGHTEEMPLVIMDADEQGRQLQRSLSDSLYNGHDDRLLLLSDFVEISDAEIEDLVPPALLYRQVDRMIRGPEVLFSDQADATKTAVPQIEDYAKAHGVELPKGWKVDLAKKVKRAMLAASSDSLSVEQIRIWETLLKRINTGSTEADSQVEGKPQAAASPANPAPQAD